MLVIWTGFSVDGEQVDQLDLVDQAGMAELRSGFAERSCYTQSCGGFCCPFIFTGNICRTVEAAMRIFSLALGFASWTLFSVFFPGISQNSIGDELKKGPLCRIVLVAGETAKQDKIGHHDYLAGCHCLEVLLKQTPGIEAVFVRDGWPDDESIFNDCQAVVFYTDGGGKQAFLKTPERIARMKRLTDSGVGLVLIHQAVDFPDEFESDAKSWLGGVYLKEKSGRGHWPSTHVDFPEHPVTRGVEPWQINDGWLNGLVFVDKMAGVTPLVWSGKVYEGSRSGRDPDVVGWAYERNGGGRSFCFTGLDAHSAWSLPGMRKLMVNGVLWSAGLEIPDGGALSEIEEQQLTEMQTPREPKPPAKTKGSK